jgi:hypothetical protein
VYHNFQQKQTKSVPGADDDDDDDDDDINLRPGKT